MLTSVPEKQIKTAKSFGVPFVVAASDFRQDLVLICKTAKGSEALTQ